MMLVDYFQNKADMQVALLGALGFSTDYISKLTRLTECQVSYRLWKAKIRRTDYRNGNSPLCRVVQTNLGSTVQNQIRGKLKLAMKAS